MSIFENLFVLELANNHWGSLERGLKIIDDYSKIVRDNGIRAAIKLQFRDVDTFVHDSFKDRADIRYVKKTLDTKMSEENFLAMISRIKQNGLVPMATPFDEKSVDLCVKLNLPIIKIASSDINDIVLVKKIIETQKPSIVSTGGASLEDIDNIVQLFSDAGVPLAVNHCVSLYPSEDNQLELNQIDLLRERYPKNVIGFSTHEYHDWTSSIMMAYAKGARVFERHIDIDYQGVPVSSYCSLPEQADQWFKAFKKAIEMCGRSSRKRRKISSVEAEYLTKLLRGAYAKRDLAAGYILTPENMLEDFHLAIPLQDGQLSCREVHKEYQTISAVKANEPIMVSQLRSLDRVKVQ